MKTNDSLPKFNLLVIITVAAIGGLLAWGIPQYSNAKTIEHKINHTPKLPVPVVAAPANVPIVQPVAVASPAKISVKLYNDTATSITLRDSIINRSKTKFKIVIEDAKGDKKEYNSVQELPDSEKSEFLKENPTFGDNHISGFQELANIEASPEWKKQALEMTASVEKMNKELAKNNPKWKAQAIAMQFQVEKMKQQLNSPEWKKQVEDMKLQAEKMKEQFNSPEWKKQVEDMKLQGDKMREQFNSPRWKKQMRDIKTQNEAIRKKFNSPEWKAQMDGIKKQSEEISKQFDSPEMKKQMRDLSDKIQKEVNDDISKAFGDSVKTSN